ncbi:hypothetical protein RIR_jg41431.t1 [Rhizophagus irregularis DAOM 181602=DAOM 197198]|nr:hypothetical protein RIR_jg41431.t1 [Rhizophagus irregularis DAOM 181602=DAOM 197198]
MASPADLVPFIPLNIDTLQDNFTPALIDSVITPQSINPSSPYLCSAPDNHYIFYLYGTRLMNKDLFYLTDPPQSHCELYAALSVLELLPTGASAEFQ